MTLLINLLKRKRESRRNTPTATLVSLSRKSTAISSLAAPVLSSKQLRMFTPTYATIRKNGSNYLNFPLKLVILLRLILFSYSVHFSS